ncbi:phosphatidylserine/phosphatidylglycerophosphate/cardiolipin synthase family protein [Rubritalea spongiae]|uniref:Phosphatidylserine/phosphatidylglycerophosphate/ cardiolipin synthase family protein n=1 Tax=Rubritalea spongiae TaxID=430797 RepID=A0ABW5E1U8_9BACT
MYAELGARAPEVSDAEFREDTTVELESTWTEGNEVETLVNGGEYFPAMLDAVKSAQKTITFETFVAVNAVVTYDLVMALSDRAENGVKVHFIIDGIGSRKMDERYLEKLRHSGVEVEIYKPMNYLSPWDCNNRDHRKILVVDGKVGFTGGAGYADCWDGDVEKEWRWRDTMYCLRGPVVADLQHAFNDNWKELTGSTLSGEEYFPYLKQEGRMKAQAVLGAPQERGDTLGASYLLAIDAAKESILIEHAYFIPNKELRGALLRARQRGVEIDIILPNDKIDTPVVRLTSRSHWPELLEAGVRIYEYGPCMLHGKLIVVDDVLSIIGSGNFDDRTFFINDELNVNVLSREFAAEQRAMFERDLAQSQRMTMEDTGYSWSERPKMWVGKLIEPQL